jgi:hypothetical protein
MVGTVLLRLIQGVVILLIGAGVLAFLWSCVVGGEVFPGDEKEPLYKQRIKVGSPFRPRSYAPRWHTWIGIAATLLFAPVAALLFSL